MGQGCKKAQSSVSYSSYTLEEIQPFPWITFNITTEKATRVDAECLVLFTEKKLKVNKNVHLVKIGQSVATKTQEYFDVALGEQPLTPGKCLLFDAQLPEFSFDQICVVCLDVWGGKLEIVKPLEACLELLLKTLKRGNIKKFILSSFGEEYGIPILTANLCLVESLKQEGRGISHITYLADKMDEVSSIRECLEKGSDAGKGMSRGSSAYY